MRQRHCGVDGVHRGHRQVIADALHVPLAVEDLSHFEPDRREREAARLIGEEAARISRQQAAFSLANVFFILGGLAVLGLAVTASGLLDLRDLAACASLGINVARAKEDWIAALDRGEEPPSWRVAEMAQAVGAVGLIDGSRRVPGEWHLVLFRWNEAGGATVTIAPE